MNADQWYTIAMVAVIGGLACIAIRSVPKIVTAIKQRSIDYEPLHAEERRRADTAISIAAAEVRPLIGTNAHLMQEVGHALGEMRTATRALVTVATSAMERSRADLKTVHLNTLGKLLVVIADPSTIRSNQPLLSGDLTIGNLVELLELSWIDEDALQRFGDAPALNKSHKPLVAAALERYRSAQAAAAAEAEAAATAALAEEERQRQAFALQLDANQRRLDAIRNGQDPTTITGQIAAINNDLDIDAGLAQLVGDGSKATAADPAGETHTVSAAA